MVRISYSAGCPSRIERDYGEYGEIMIQSSELGSMRAPTGSNLKTVSDFLAALDDPRRDAIQRFHADHAQLFSTAKGSAEKHQAWPGGYLDHIGSCFRLAASAYSALCDELQDLVFPHFH